MQQQKHMLIPQYQLGLVAHTPAIVVSTTDIGSPPAGLQTIDGVTLVAGNRVLLVGQTNPVENGLWLAASWCIGHVRLILLLVLKLVQAYVLITSRYGLCRIKLVV